MTTILVEELAGRFDESTHIRIAYEQFGSDDRPHGVYISSNGYQWSGFTMRDTGQLTVLRDAIDEYLLTCHEEGVR